MSGNLAHSPADVLRYAMIDLTLGELPASGATWPIYVGREPDEPDDAITIYDTAGEQQGRLGPTGETVDFFGIQIRVRSSKNTTGWVKARAIADSLDKNLTNREVTISSSNYVIYGIARDSGPFSIGKESESSKRHIYTTNFLITLSQTS